MATMTITIPDDRVADVVDSLALQWGYVAGLGESKPQFVRRSIMEHLELAYRRGKRKLHEQQFSDPSPAGVEVA